MKVTLIGMGCGSEKLQTAEALDALRQAEVLIGAKRLLDGVKGLPALCHDAVCSHGKPFGAGALSDASRQLSVMAGMVSFYEAVSAEAVHEIICREDGRNICVLYSGDTGFYSGVRTLLPLLDENGIEARVLPGISSLQLFSAKIGLPWQEWNLVSAHGTHCNAVNAVMQGKPAFFLTGGKLGPAALCKQIADAGLSELAVIVGGDLSYGAERIYRCTAREAAAMGFAPLSVMLAAPAPVYSGKADAESDGFWHKAAGFESVPLCSSQTIPDSQFVRGSVPMTKRDVRAAVLGRLRIRPDDVIWDIGAGTGSVSVELALAARMGQVFAAECDEEACRLIETNRHRFGAWNLSVIRGTAPQCLRKLPPPDVVFIGGSKGMMAEIVAHIHQRNKNARICITAIALETLQAAISALASCGWEADVTQISVSRAKKAGALSLMMAHNPVFLITNENENKCER